MTRDVSRATREHGGSKTAQLLLWLLVFNAGMFAASTALLPSSFVMYAITLAAAAVIDNRPLLVVVHGSLGVMLGWVVAGLLPPRSPRIVGHPS
jgi:alpha-1,2-mannosyltransferase